jgi:hypothetical protein
MVSWFRKPVPPAPEPEQPEIPRMITVSPHAMFAHLIAAIDAVDLARNPPSDESDPPGVVIGR